MKKVMLAALLASAGSAFGQTAYTVTSNGTDHLYRINLATGIAQDVGLVNFGDAEGLSFGPGGDIFAIGGSIEEFWNVTTPPGALVGSTGTQNGTDAGLDFYNGTMYNVSATLGNTELYKVNPATGATSLIGSGAYFADSIAIDPTTGIAYGADGVTNDGMYTIDLNTGAGTFLGSFGIGSVSVQSASGFTPDGTLYVFFSNGDMYKINKSTGAASFLYTVVDTGGATLANCEGLAIDSGAASCVTITFEVTPGPDGVLGTGDDVPIVAPTTFTAQTTQLTNEFASVGVLFSPAAPINDQNEVLDAATFTTPPAHTAPNLLASQGTLPIRVQFTSPASSVSALLGISGGADTMTAFTAGGGIIGSVTGDDTTETIDAGSAIIDRIEIIASVGTTPAIDNLEVCFGNAPCYADCDGNGTLNIFDYICFGNAYSGSQAYADCDGNGSFNIFDYICFGNAYAAGCP